MLSMKNSDYEYIQHALKIGDIQMACSHLNSSYIQTIIDEGKEAKLNEQFVKLFELLDIDQTLAFTSEILTPS